jgi:hypothetical protein
MTNVKGDYKTLLDASAARSSSTVVSTRDLDVDWESWEQHVFFGSAQARVDSAVEFIRTTFPFDGTKGELNTWRGKINGWENWLLENKWLYNLRSVNFDYTDVLSPSTDPTKPLGVPAIYTIDLEVLKAKETEIETVKTFNRLNPKAKSLSVEFWIKVSDDAAIGWTNISTHRNIEGEGWTVLFERVGDVVRFGAHLSISLGVLSTNYAQSHATTINEFELNEWHHVNISWTSASEGRDVRIVVDGNVCELDNVLNEINMTEGIWDTQNIDPHWLGWAPSPQINQTGDVSTLFGIVGAGAFQIDEYRLWHKQLEINEIERNRYVNVWAQEDLILQYRFNDSPETMLSFQGEPLFGILDSSGNSLHGQRQPGNFVSVPTGQQPLPQLILDVPPDLKERPSNHPTIYPLDSGLNAILNEIRETGKDYDESNPNLITKLVPQHYFRSPINFSVETEDQDFSGENGAILLAALLYTWADFWDDLKLRGDALITALHINPDSTGSARPLLPVIAKELGVSLPMIFEDVLPENWDEEFESLQEQAWRRVLMVMPGVLKRKGTIAGIKSLFNAVGNVQVDGAIRFREFGFQSSTIAESKKEVEQQIRFVRTTNPPIIRFTRSRLA